MEDAYVGFPGAGVRAPSQLGWEDVTQSRVPDSQKHPAPPPDPASSICKMTLMILSLRFSPEPNFPQIRLSHNEANTLSCSDLGALCKR